jgi:DNA-binding HxlR family transcriptional regulator
LHPFLECQPDNHDGLGLIVRKDCGVVPPKVEYRLTRSRRGAQQKERGVAQSGGDDIREIDAENPK